MSQSPDRTAETTGKRLQRLRQGAGLSQSQLADAAGVPVGTIRSIEYDRRGPLLETAVKLAGALGVSLDELAGVTKGAQRSRGKSGASTGQVPPAAVPPTPPAEDLEAEGEQPHPRKALGKAKQSTRDGKAKRPGRRRQR
jgi:transcriptional regulator with XRE-family HTH domain